MVQISWISCFVILNSFKSQTVVVNFMELGNLWQGCHSANRSYSNPKHKIALPNMVWCVIFSPPWRVYVWGKPKNAVGSHLWPAAKTAGASQWHMQPSHRSNLVWSLLSIVDECSGRWGNFTEPRPYDANNVTSFILIYFRMSMDSLILLERSVLHCISGLV